MDIKSTVHCIYTCFQQSLLKQNIYGVSTRSIANFFILLTCVNFKIENLTRTLCREKKEEIWLSPMTKAPTPTEMSKGQSDNKVTNKTILNRPLKFKLSNCIWLESVPSHRTEISTNHDYVWVKGVTLGRLVTAALGALYHKREKYHSDRTISV